MFNKMSILKFMALSALICASKAFAMTDDEANRTIMQACIDQQ